jgi:DNA-directed RNA polymerase specialized sigma24 family protein/ribosome-associated translation inhibitor RaiA
MKLTVRIRSGSITQAGRGHLDHRIAEITRRLPEKIVESSSLAIVFDAVPKKALVRLTVRLTLPGRLLTAADEGKDETGVINRVFGELARMVTRARRRRARVGASATVREAVRSQPVLLSQDINALYRFVEGELSQLEVGGDLPSDAASAREILSDVLLAALEGWEARPEGFPVMPYLFRTAIARIGRETARASEGPGEILSLDARQPRSLPSELSAGISEDYWEFWQSDDSPAMEETLSGGGEDDPFDIILREEERRLLAKLLSPFGRPMRQAVVLHETEAFEAEEIALIQGRTREEVLHDLAEGRRLLDRAEEVQGG